MVNENRLINALRRANEICLGTSYDSLEACATDTEALMGCGNPKALSDPESVIVFRKPLPLEPVKIGREQDDVGPFPESELPFDLGCVKLFKLGLKATLALDLIHEQRWCFQSQAVSALSTTISLAPNEKLSLTIRNTQRKLFDQTNLDEVEQNESTESLIVDRDIVNVTRSSTKTSNWQVSGNASVSIPIKAAMVNLGVGGSVSKSVTDSAQSSAEHVSEATLKSAKNLRNLQKVEVKETAETFEDRERSRVIVNPYRDRSLSLNMYSLGKEYLVDFVLTHLRPSIILEFTNVKFDRDFVIANGDFLQQHLQDVGIRFELSEALEAATDDGFGSALEDVQELAQLALKYLFDVPNIFNVADISQKAGDFTIWTDANSPDSSFDAQSSKSGLNDAVDSKLSMIFSTINFYFKLYRDEVKVGNPDLAVSVALSLEAALKPLWLTAEETQDISNVHDQKHRTEAFRRLGGFLALVSGSIRPLLEPAEKDRARIEAARRAEFVISRVVNHLKCHRDFYIGQYLRYLTELTGGLTIRRFIEDALAQVSDPPELEANWDELFAIEEAFVDRNSVVVPGRCLYDEEASSSLIEMLDRDGKQNDLKFGILRRERVVVPTDGTYIESRAGDCILPDVPEPTPEPSFRISLNDGPLRVSVSQES
ncbi:MAG: hypothetical protein ACFB50_07935 [Rubrobacteraceae bacterium]